MSATRDDGKSPGGGENKGKEKDQAAQVVGAENQSGGKENSSKHADEDGFWTERTGAARKSKLFGNHGHEENQEENEAGMALAPNNKVESDEDMELPQLAASPTPADRKNQPESKKRRFAAVPQTPRRKRTLVQGAAGLRTTSAASLGDISALFAAAKEILEQGRAAEMAATAGWKRMEMETQAHKDGISSMFAKITAVQSDFRTTMERDDALAGALQELGNTIDRNTDGTDTVNGTVAGAAVEIGWLKARVAAMEGKVEQARLEAAAAKDAATAAAQAVDQEQKEQKKRWKEERERKAEAEERLIGAVHSTMESVVKQVTKLENVAYRKQDNIRARLKADHGKDLAGYSGFKNERSEAEERLTGSVHAAIGMMDKQMGQMEKIAYRREDEMREIIKNEHKDLVILLHPAGGSISQLWCYWNIRIPLMRKSISYRSAD